MAADAGRARRAQARRPRSGVRGASEVALGVRAATVRNAAGCGAARRPAYVPDRTGSTRARTQSHLCLGTDGSALAMRACDGSAHQLWMANDDGQFENVGTGVCLHSDEAGRISVGECLDLPLLTWKPHTHDRVANAGTGFCLAAQDQDISSSACGSGPSQTWTLAHRTV
ncbi:ricin-type beta-trefoil lectin domain protein [Streptomyces sp. 24-1644]|uniref:ricin-type beta-trefoil lectin domain protein n=1 Tax=Streptomyces sp. 24-1644 TaxID=3457315 RepID=UPI003FA69999